MRINIHEIKDVPPVGANLVFAPRPGDRKDRPREISIVRRLAALLLASAILFPVSAGAGVILSFEANSSKEEGHASRFTLDGKKLRAEDPHGAVMIFDGEKQTLWTIDPKGKRYTEVTEADANRIKEMQAQMEQQMKERLKALPPDQRKEMEERLEGMRAKPTEAPKLTFEPTGDAKKTKHGFSCRPHRVLANGKPIEEACFIPWKEAGLSVDDFQAFDALDQFFRKLGTQGGNQQNQIFGDLAQSPGIPAHVAMIGPDGTLGIEQDLVLLKKEEIPSDQFIPPAGLKKESLFGGGGGGGEGHGDPKM